MKFPRVKSFLFCMSLKTGGYIIGWVSIFVSLITLLYLIVSMVAICMHPSEYINWTGVIAWMIILNFYTIFIVLLIFSACVMMRGILKRNSNKIIPFLICTVFGFIFGFIQITATGTKGVFPALLGAFVDFYMFVCMFSLYKRLEEEELEHSKYIQRVSAISRV